MLCLGLSACQRDVILQGERFDLRTPLEDSVAVEGKPAPTPPAAFENRALPLALPAPRSFADWTHRGGSAQHMAGNGVLSATPQKIWSVGIGAGNSQRARIAASPVIAAGQVYTMDAAGKVSAVSMAGNLVWQADLAASTQGKVVTGGGLAADGNHVFATTGAGELVALNASTGAVEWRQAFTAPTTGAPTVSGKVVYAMGADGGALAVAVDTGRILWSIEGTGTTGGMVGSASPAISGGDVIFPFASGEIEAVEASSGTAKWIAAVAGQRLGRAYAALGDVTGDPVVSGGVIYAGTAAGRTIAADAATGTRKWVATEGAMNPPLVVAGSVFVVSDDARLVRLDAANGDLIWAVDMPYYVKDKPKKLKRIYAHYGPVLAGGRIVVASSDGLLRMFDPVTGAMVGSVDIPGGAASAPALAGGMLFVVGGNGQLHAFR